MKTCRLRHQGLDETKRVEMEGELANELKEDGRLTFTELLWKDRVNGGLDETKRVEMEGELANELKEDGRLTFTEFLWKDRVNGDREGRSSGKMYILGT